MSPLRRAFGAVAAIGLMSLAACELFLPEASGECSDLCVKQYDVTCATKTPSWERDICPSLCTIMDDSNRANKFLSSNDCDLVHVLFTGNTDDYCKVVHEVCGANAACAAGTGEPVEFECRTKWLATALFWQRQGGCSGPITKACAKVSAAAACTGTADPATCK